MTKTSILATLLFGALVAVGPIGCSRFKPSGPDAMGTVTFMLTATGASGTVYRLRSATFMLTGPETKSIASPTDPADTLAAITSQLRPGTYQITLASGWQMWRIPMAGAPVMIPATLISPATTSFMVVSAQDSKVFYQFDVAGDTMVPGTLTIGIGVTEVDGGLDASTDAGAAGTTGAAGAAGSGGATGSAGATGAAGNAGATGAGGTAGAAGTGVCGDHIVQSPEQCDDGVAGSATCSATCMTLTAVSMCLTCETDGTTAGVCLGTKVSSTGPVGCAGLSTADARTKCTTLLSCLQLHPSCSIGGDHTVLNNDPTDCFCGTLDVVSCAGATATTINGPCADAYYAVYGATKASATSANRDSVLMDFFNKALPVGMADHLYGCDVDNNCQSKCP